MKAYPLSGAEPKVINTIKIRNHYVSKKNDVP